LTIEPSLAPLLLKWSFAVASRSRLCAALRGDPFSSPWACARPSPLSFAYYYMKSSPNSAADQEPIGIVISRGTHLEKAPTVYAYVWGPAPELPEDKSGRQVA
jgi:hypothetical protein